MARRGRYGSSKADKVRKHLADHHAAYEKHFKAAAKNVPEPGAKGHDAAWQAAQQMAQQATAQDMAGAGAGQQAGPPGAPPQAAAAAGMPAAPPVGV